MPTLRPPPPFFLPQDTMRANCPLCLEYLHTSRERATKLLCVRGWQMGGNSGFGVSAC